MMPGPWRGHRQLQKERLANSFDDLVRLRQQDWQHGEAERHCGLEIDHQLEFVRLDDRQVARLGSGENLAGVNTEMAKIVGQAAVIARQPSGVDKLPPLVDTGHPITLGERDDLRSSAVVRCVGAHQQRCNLRFDQAANAASIS